MGQADLRYPVGEFHYDGSASPTERQQRIQEIAALPQKLEAAVAGLADERLDSPYRPGGWTVRQVVHHLPDSHLNAYVRIKLALTEDTPTIRPYDQALWAELPEARTAPIRGSIELVRGLHQRWVAMLTAMTDTDWQRAYFHPEMQRKVPLDEVVAMYAWHCRHHVAHITSLRKREGW